MNTLPNVQTLENLPRPEDGPKRRVYENVADLIADPENPTPMVRLSARSRPSPDFRIFQVPASSMEELVSLCKRRGFIFQSSDIYGGLQGMYDYGPLGVELKNNLKAAWWRAMVYERDDVEGLDALDFHGRYPLLRWPTELAAWARPGQCPGHRIQPVESAPDIG